MVSHINVICGENSTGKTTILKCLYALLKPYSRKNTETLTKDQLEVAFVEKLAGVFRPEEKKIGRLVSRRQGNGRASITMELERVILFRWLLAREADGTLSWK